MNLSETDESPSHFKTIAIIGLGLIGGSFARLIHHQFPQTQLLAYDTDPTALQKAKEAGIIQDALSTIEDPRLFEADLVVLGTHLAASQMILMQIAQQATQTIRVMDLGSTKTEICATADMLGPHLEFIGGHPLAGREVSGFENGRWDLFLGKRFLLTPCAKTQDGFQATIVDWLHQLGTCPAVMTAGEHDQLMAVVSHFPQFYAVALANLLSQQNPDETLHFLGGGIDDQMRLMASSYAMWGDVFSQNKTAVTGVLDQFIHVLTQMRADLQQDNLGDWFARSHQIYAMYQSNKDA